MEKSALDKWFNGDTSGYERLWSKHNFTYFDGVVTERIEDHATMAEFLKTIDGKLFADSYDFHNPRVQTGQDMAILTYQLFAKTTLDEEACARIGWSPYHGGQGYDANDNTITVGSALMWGNNMAPSTDDPERITQLVAWDIAERCQFALGSGKQYTYRTILLTEPVARILKKEYADKEQFERTLIETARRPLHERAFANYYANPGSRIDPETFPISRYEKRLTRTEGASPTPCPEWYAQPEGCRGTQITTIPVMKPDMTAILITGDNARNKVQIMPGGGYSTVEIRLPENWNTLMREAGYAPLAQFYIGK